MAKNNGVLGTMFLVGTGTIVAWAAFEAGRASQVRRDVVEEEEPGGMLPGGGGGGNGGGHEWLRPLPTEEGPLPARRPSEQWQRPPHGPINGK